MQSDEVKMAVGAVVYWGVCVPVVAAIVLVTSPLWAPLALLAYLFACALHYDETRLARRRHAE